RAQSGLSTVTQIQVEGVAIDHGSHLCALYESDLGRVKLAVPFLAGGLEANDVCCLVAAPDAQKDILDHLGAVHTRLGEFVDGGRLHVSEGLPSGRAMSEQMEEAFVEATRSGQCFVRILGDMTWALHQGMDVDELMEFEMRYDQSLARRFAVVTLCQYDARKFPGTALLSALKCHQDTFRYPLARFLN
ncbi:MAG: MEDS domain-containing protein, partial [Alphaproteobacteria bacterium]